MKTFLLTLAAVSLLWSAGNAHAQTPTVIDHLPYEITSSGTYVLNGNLSCNDPDADLITVDASNVTIDFQGHYISGLVGNTDQDTRGIYAYERSNLTVKNGTIAYCRIGIALVGNGAATTNSVDHRIDNLRVTYCYYAGISIANSPATRVTKCQISQIGFASGFSASGILCQGAGVTVQGNVVSTVTAVNSYGIFADTGDFVRRNTISNAHSGVVSGKYQDNLTSGCTTPFNGGINAGGNN